MKYHIYKIYKPETDYLYIGSTNKFSSRKSHHKKNTYNKVKKSYHRLIYKTIRDNGGWDEFKIEIIETIECELLLEARQREQYYINLYKPNLNLISSTIHIN